VEDEMTVEQIDKTRTGVRWIIEGTLELATPLHLGSGEDEEIAGLQESGQTWVASIVRDARGQPYLPGSSIKGALRALAQRCQPDNKDFFATIFGRENAIETEIGKENAKAGKANTKAGQAEFYGASMRACPTISSLANFRADTFVAHTPHTAIDRFTRTAADNKLFHTTCVPPGAQFVVRIVVQGCDAETVEWLHAVLDAAKDDPLFSLGAHSSQSIGKVSWCGKLSVKRFSSEEATEWLAAIRNGEARPWSDFAVERPIKSAKINSSAEESIVLPVALKFHSPFMVKQDSPKGKDKDQANATPRLDHRGHPLLPAASMHGALRAQAERILRTLGSNCPQGHDAKPYTGQPMDDLAALLFGTAGWQSPVRVTDFVARVMPPAKLSRQEMIAIDRFTGGGKEGAKFNVDYCECPELTGALKLDMRRLHKYAEQSAEHEKAVRAALRLFTLVLRDLGEGDISFGYGRAKGYGQCTVEKLWANWEGQFKTTKLGKLKISGASDAVQALRDRMGTPAILAETSAATAAAKKKSANAVQAAPNGQGDFHNPYHFIPFAEPETGNWQQFGDLWKSHHGHHRYVGLSGRIVCKLTTKTPVFIGNRRTKEAANRQPAEIDNFRLNGKIALPATSLRGMISSLFESISDSNLRVLEAQKYSVRKAMSSSLSAMGLVHKRGDDLYLEPLCLPTLLGDAYCTSFDVPKKWGWICDKVDAPFKVYLNYCKVANITDGSSYFLPEKILDLKIKSAVEKRTFEISSFTKFKPQLDKLDKQKERGRFFLGMNTTVTPTTATIQGEPCVRGFVRTLITDNREKELPRNVKHLHFIPYPESRDALNDEERGFKKIGSDVVKRFHALADLALGSMNGKPEECVQEVLLPFVPVGRKAADRNAEEKFNTKLSDGDLVFFDVDDNSEISEISFSSIWREGLGKSDFYTSADFIASVDSNLLPWGMTSENGQTREKLSPVELLFGAVKDMGRTPDAGSAEAAQDRFADAFAGKVRIGYGLPPEGHVPKLDDAVTLKELSSPKPPSPAMYFRHKLGNNSYVSKRELARTPSDYRSNGRKQYLHAARQENKTVKNLDSTGNFTTEAKQEPWRSQFDKQQDDGHKRRVKVKPIAQGEIFYFEVDFDNLTQQELEQLCATLYPSKEFEHKIGMGKPIGLGSVKIEPVGLYLVDRHKRYGEDPVPGQRYHTVLKAVDEPDKWPLHLQREWQIASTDKTKPLTDYAIEGMKKVDGEVREAILLLGDPDKVNKPVHYPQVADKGIESENYLWFVANDELKKRDYLCDTKQPLGKIGQGLPALKRHKKVSR
jgi:CRISPR-associated protein (TIGR03986 family)